MRVYQQDDELAHPSRARNWGVAQSDASFRYYDFRLHPELITEVLEDFRPFSGRAAVQKFYAMLASLNGERSPFETNDSAFNAPALNDSPGGSAKVYQVSGRVMVLFRDLALNTLRDNLEWLEEGIHRHAGGLTPEFADGVLGTSIMRMHMPELGSDREPLAGHQLAVHFWAWGDSDEEVFENLAVVIDNLHISMTGLSKEWETRDE